MIAVVLLLAQAAGAAPAPAPSPEPVMSAYVAHVLAGRELGELPCPEGKVCSEFHPGFELRLEVERPLAGPVRSGIRTTEFYAHSGFPQFGRYEYALVFEFVQAKGASHLSRDGFPLALAANGRWAFCADPERVPEIAQRGRSVKLAHPIHLSPVTGDMDSDQAEWDSMREGERECRRGVYAEDLVKMYAAKAEPSFRYVIEFDAPKK